jgi:hypothetical protein
MKMGGTLNYIEVIFGLVVVAVLSVYKLVQIYRYRKDPAKREWFLNQTQVFPDKIRRFVLDENYNEKHGIGRAPDPGRK